MTMLKRVLAGLFLSGLAILIGAWAASRVAPLVNRATIGLPGWPAGRPPVRVVLIADIHLGNASMNEGRLDDIIRQVNRLRPDLVLAAGDFLAAYDKPAAPARSAKVAAALARLRAPLGVVAVLGNHDYGTDQTVVADALAAAGITVLRNQAVVRGPLVIGGLGDGYSGNARLPETLAAMRGLRGARIMLAHTPADARSLPDDIPLLLAGHTHCGQVVLPVVGALVIPSVPRRYLCGVIRDGARTIIVSGGLGTSSLPIRVHSPPDLWLVTLGPTARPAAG